LLRWASRTCIDNAGGSAEVFRQVKARHFDIILSDYQLEDGRDSQQVLEELRENHLVALSYGIHHHYQ
jgi:CheY-like chemotaxis protein